MVSGPHGDPVVIEEAADVIGVMLTEVESNYPFTLRRAVKDQIRYRAQGIERVAHQRLLILGNLRQSQLADVGQRRAEANDPPGIRRAGLKAPRRLIPGVPSVRLTVAIIDPPPSQGAIVCSSSDRA